MISIRGAKIILELCKFLDEYLHGCIILVQIVWRIAFFVLPLRLN